MKTVKSNKEGKTMKEKKLPIFKNGNEKFRAHDKGCAHCYRKDRRQGIFYGCVEDKALGRISWGLSSFLHNFCAYCATK
jgi:hypothetical protein